LSAFDQVVERVSDWAILFDNQPTRFRNARNRFETQIDPDVSLSEGTESLFSDASVFQVIVAATLTKLTHDIHGVQPTVRSPHSI
jgi:hypothetical protein